MKQQLTLQWSGLFIELCLGRLTPAQQQAFEACRPEENLDIATAWYLNADLLHTHFGTPNWWAIDDVEHTMGLLFGDRAELKVRLGDIAFAIDGAPVTVDPEAIQISVYAPEATPHVAAGDAILRHGARRQGQLQLTVELTSPFDPSLVTLSLLDHPGEGLILIDLDYDGHDDVRYSFGRTTYLKPRCVKKEDS